MIEIMKYILNDELDEFTKYTTKQKIFEEEIDELYKIFLYFQKYKFIEVLLNNKYYPPNMTVFYAIKKNLIGYINLLKNHKIKLDIINKNGLSPVEYSIYLYSQDKTYYEIVIILNNFKYTRNPKWFDLIMKTKLYNIQPKNQIDESILHNITSHKDNLTIVEINNYILLNLIQNNKLFEMMNYIKNNLKFINFDVILDDISLNNRKEVLHYIENFIITNNKLFRVYFNLHLYEKIIKNKENMDYDDIINYIVEKIDLHGVIFLYEYLRNDDIKKIVNSNGDTLLHVLCKYYNHIEQDNFMIQKKFIRILLNYDSEIVNAKNNQGYTPIFLAYQNNYLTEILLSVSDLNIRIENDETYLHHIIKNGNMNVLNKIFMYQEQWNNELINMKNQDGETPLLLASKMLKQDCCNLLIHNGADIRICDNDGNTIFHYICLYNLTQIDITSIPEIKNNNDETPSGYVIKYINSEFENL
jgi:ankyrin repeat protein